MRRRWPKLLFLLSLLLLGGGYALEAYDVLTLTGIEIRGTERIDAAQIPVTIGKDIFELNLAEIVDSVMAFKFVDHVSARIGFQRELIVTVREKEPVCYLYTGKLYGLTSRCEILPLQDCDSSLSLPVIRGLTKTSMRPYERMNDSSLFAAMKLINTIRVRYPERFVSLSEIILTDNGLKLILQPGSLVVNIGPGDCRSKIDRLEVILAANKNPGLDIDLRFTDLAILKSRNSNREVKDGS